jgi:hypothetical protein
VVLHVPINSYDLVIKQAKIYNIEGKASSSLMFILTTITQVEQLSLATQHKGKTRLTRNDDKERQTLIGPININAIVIKYSY